MYNKQKINSSIIYVPAVIAGTVMVCALFFDKGYSSAKTNSIDAIKNAQTTIYDKANTAPNLSIEERKEFLELGDHLGDAARLLQGEDLNEIIEDEVRRIEVQRINEEVK